MDEVVGSQQRVAALEEQLEAVLQRLDVLEHENQALRSAQAAPAAAPAPGAEHADNGVTRRRLLVGSVGAAAAGAAAMVASAGPAAANSQGQSWTLGDMTNTATSQTGLSSTADPTLLVNQDGTSGNAVQFYGHNDNGTGAVLHAETKGLGGAGEFVQSKATNPATNLAVYTAGLGVAGGFVIDNVNNRSAGLSVLTSGTGAAVSASAKGGGSAGFFVANGTNAAMSVTNSGAGNTAYFNSTSSALTEPGLVSRTVGAGAAIRAQGAVTHLNVWPRAAGAPTGDTTSHNAGDVVEDSTSTLWLCVAGGTPGKWRKLGGPDTAGQFHLLAAPARIYDSRPGTFPSVGSKTPLNAGQSRTLDATVNSSGVPAGATGAVLNLLVVNSAAGPANFTVWANGVAKPLGNSMVWGGAAGGRYSSLAASALDASGQLQVNCSVKTDIVVDVVGYYR